MAVPVPGCAPPVGLPDSGLLVSRMVMGRVVRASEFQFKGRVFDCLNPMLMGVVALFVHSNAGRPGFVPDAFGNPMRIDSLGDWNLFAAELRNSWNKCCNDAVVAHQSVNRAIP